LRAMGGDSQLAAAAERGRVVVIPLGRWRQGTERRLIWYAVYIIPAEPPASVQRLFDFRVPEAMLHRAKCCMTT
jgi:hypothetical protein